MGFFTPAGGTSFRPYDVQDPGLISPGIDHPDGMTLNKSRAGKPASKRKNPWRTYAVHILAGDVRKVVVRAQSSFHAGLRAEAEYQRTNGEAGEFVECDHMELACYEITEAAR